MSGLSGPACQAAQLVRPYCGSSLPNAGGGMLAKVLALADTSLRCKVSIKAAELYRSGSK